MKPKKTREIFSMSFLDIMACGFGALVLILLISEFQESETKVIENSANKYLSVNDEKNTKIEELKNLSKEVKKNIESLVAIKTELKQSIDELEIRKSIAKNLNNLANSKQASVDFKLQPAPSSNQTDASGIKLDSKYLVFIIDNSGSMQSSGPWTNIINEINNIINTFPDLQGYLIMNDSGNIIHGGSPWLKPSKSNRSTSINLLKVNPNKYMSLSNPILGLKKVINSYGSTYPDIGVFIVGDDVLDNNRMENIANSILKINQRSTGEIKVRINAIAFLTSKDEKSYEQQNMNYLMLMRELTEQSDGALVVVN